MVGPRRSATTAPTLVRDVNPRATVVEEIRRQIGLRYPFEIRGSDRT